MGASDIVLATVNATWSHPAFGLRCLRANLGALRERSALVEFDPRGIPAAARAAAILALRPRVVGLGVHIWNAEAIEVLARDLRRANPGLILVLGGPEISHEWEDQPVARLADHIVRGEGETVFADLCAAALSGRPCPDRVVEGGRPDLARLARPYGEYSDRDLATRFTYVETTRGCPFGCEFCLSSLDPVVREWPLEAVLADFDALMARGARRFKFVDRTFNLDPDRAAAVLRFFLDRARPGLTAQFELVPGRLTPCLRDLLRRFPAGSLRLEVGVQTFDESAAARAGRRQRNADVEDTLRFLRDETRATVHADLLAGLPGEDLASFGRGFDRLLALGPAEIQMGVLKRLRGTAVARRAAERGMSFHEQPPYLVRATPALTARDLERIARLARYWERLGNRGDFASTLPFLWRDGGSPFDALLALSDALYDRFSATHGIALDDLADAIAGFLRSRGVPGPEIASAMARDWTARGRRIPRLPSLSLPPDSVATMPTMM